VGRPALEGHLVGRPALEGLSYVVECELDMKIGR
jgi:hypothetical protein